MSSAARRGMDVMSSNGCVPFQANLQILLKINRAQLCLPEALECHWDCYLFNQFQTVLTLFYLDKLSDGVRYVFI